MNGPTTISLCDVGMDFTIRESATGALTLFRALDSVTLDIHEGEFVALVGASGCGKTTILNLVAGLLTPTSGTVVVRGNRPTCPNLDIGYMFARDALLPWRSARANVELSLEPRKEWSRSDRRVRAEEMLHLVGLEAAATRYPLQLSQGM